MLERQVLPQPYRRQMEDHFNRVSDELQRARGFAADRESWLARRDEVLWNLWHALGGRPERTPLNAEVTGRIERDGYSIEKVVYQSRPDFYVTGALYLPRVDHAVPGVFCPHGHWPDGRYHAEVQRRMIGFAKRGYVVLTVDAVGVNDLEPAGPHRSRAAFLAGLATQGVEVWNNMRGIDLLCSRPEVDPTRIGCTGCSGGGNQTMYVSALDERIKASAPVCSVELGECYVHKQFCTCETVPGLRRFADLVDVCGLIAPRALLLVHGLLDMGFRIDSARKAFVRLRDIFHALGAGDRLEHFTSYDVHAYNQEMREAVYAWFDRHLKGLGPPYAPEAPGEPETPAALSSFPDGLPSGAVSMTGLYLALSEDLPPRPEVGSAAEWQAEAMRLRDGLSDLVSGWPDPTPLRPHVLSRDEETIGGTAATVDTLYCYSEPDVVVPAVLYRPKSADGPIEVVVRTGDNGRSGVPEEAVAADLAAGHGALLVDPRGTGETRSEAAGSEISSYLTSVTLGRHHCAMRAWDLRRAADWLLGRDDVSTVALGIHGGLLSGLTGLLAAASDTRWSRVEIETLLASYKHQHDDFGEWGDEGQLAIIPRLLELADVEDLLALVAPRPLQVGRWVDGHGRPVDGPPPQRCQAVYGLLGAAACLRLPG